MGTMAHKHLHRITIYFILGSALLGMLALEGTQANVLSQEPTPLKPRVIYPASHDLSRSLESVSPLQATGEAPAEPPPVLPLPKAESAFPLTEVKPDPALQILPVAANMPGLDFNFEGLPNRNNVLPPDTNGDVGPNHYVQWVNLSLAIWELDRNLHTATLVYGPVNGNTLWAGFGGACQTSNDGDPIVLYDHLADRWLISQFALPYYPSGPFYQCIAVSQTGDPTGAWYRYFYQWENGNGQPVMNDYPHFGVWPDAYYLTVNQFASVSQSWRGAGVAAFERDKMLSGQPARMVYFDLYHVNSAYGGMLPADLDGAPPPAGTPNYFAEADDSSWIPNQDALRIWEFHVDWSNPNNATFGIDGDPNQTLPVSGFNPQSGRVPQPNTSALLDPLADRLMHRLQYRNFGSYATLVANHTVDAGSGRAGVRWYELRHGDGGWDIHQQGTFAGGPSDTLYRWMASAAMDRAGDIAIGYSTSSNAQYPSIVYAGRLAGDAPGTLLQGEATLQPGSGSQTHISGRWGDYSMLSVDPLDDCTFWYTNQYYLTTSSASWRTHIGSFAFPSCFGPLTGSLKGTVTGGGSPLAGATVQAGAYSTQTISDGSYSFPALPVGTYTVTASAYGYQPATALGVEVVVNAATTQDFSLVASQVSHVHGVVRDNSGQGWPLYARIQVSAQGSSQVLYTDPFTGAYDTFLPTGIDHTFTVEAVTPGYQVLTTHVIPLALDIVQDFALDVDLVSCQAPGYILTGTCTAQQSGGLLVGHVYDANYPDTALNGATIASQEQPADMTQTFATPDDPHQDDGLYILFSSLTGLRPFNATNPGYGARITSTTITNGEITPLDFSLPAGRLIASPPSLTETLVPPQVITAVLTLTNTGTWPANFSITEVDAPAQVLLPTGPFAQATRHTSPKRLGDLTASAVYEYNPPATSQLPGGAVLRQWTTGLAHPWGIGIDTRNGDVWIGNVAIAGGDDHLHRFLPDGAQPGESIDTSATGAYYSASLAFDPFSGKLWQVSIGGDNCVVEVDPDARSLTGQKICPPFDHSQRGLAFNPLNRSFYSGAWTNGILYHFDRAGTILDSTNLDLNISALAYNPATQHLFVLSNANAGFDVYVLDAKDGFAILGGFDIPGLGDFEQAGMSIDCAAHLWVVNQATGEVFEVDSGESATCAYADIAWLSVNPSQGTVPQGGAQSVDVVFDASVAPSGFRQASLVIGNDTPYGPLTIPVTLSNGHILHLPLISR
jgi:hypothetical protein